MTFFFPPAMRRWRMYIVTAPFLLPGMSAAYAASAGQRDAAVPPALIGTIGCTHTRTMMVQEFAKKMQLTKRGATGNYSAQQVREIVTGVDDTIERFCRLLAAKTAATRRANLDLLESDDHWKSLLADPNGVAWLRTNGQFLAEIESLYILTQLGARLSPAGATSLRPTPELAESMSEMKLYAFTDEESAARSLLATPDKRAPLAAVLPARFDVARLAQMEATTRTTGTPLLRRYRFDMQRVDTAKSTTLRELSQAEEKELTTAMNTAVARLGILARKYAPAAARGN